MKYILLGLAITTLLGCNQIKKQENIASEIKNTTTKLKPESKNIQYPLSVEYSFDGEPDTMFVTLNNYKCLITPEGYVFKEDSSLYFNIRCQDEIERLYFYKVDSDFVAIYVDTDMDGAATFVERIDLTNNKTIWKIDAGGFNLGKPVISDNYAYLSTIGFIGKLDMKSGKFIWKFDNLYDKGKYNNFKEPTFFKENIVLFESKEHTTGRIDSIIVDDKNGKILRID
jgi:outer membrane protein assembly factor BamB